MIPKGSRCVQSIFLPLEPGLILSKNRVSFLKQITYYSQQDPFMAGVSQLPTLNSPPTGSFQNLVLTSVLPPFWTASLIQIKPISIPFLESLHQHLWSTESLLPVTLNSQGILKQPKSCFGFSCLALYSYELFVCLRQVSPI